ncbi:CGGC domain-containing protein [Methanocella sp. CWC-04]|uniref:CGGC domain-containing protein n=1 Tax=Methanooceanicella nereidis TaxID=2052831 RepID=A0AAP2W4A3_9EURY|nr:CGGC domain-containing protein [Methanocella sp. CWC-04]MCD1294015.1 CGGC domain-containing protein [Methanocella sp. CWC-04]
MFSGNLKDYSQVRKNSENAIKVGIIRCNEKSQVCPGTLCFKAMTDRTAAFEGYDKIEIIGFDTCGGCGMGRPDKILKKVEGLKMRGAEVIHLSSCMKGNCPAFDTYLEAIGKVIKLKIGTH